MSDEHDFNMIDGYCMTHRQWCSMAPTTAPTDEQAIRAEIESLRGAPVVAPPNDDCISRQEAKNHLRDVDIPYLGVNAIWAREWAASELDNVRSMPVVAPQDELKTPFTCVNCGKPIFHEPDLQRWSHVDDQYDRCHGLPGKKFAEPAPVVAGELTPCLHENVQMLAHQDDIRYESWAEVGYKFCPDCGAVLDSPTETRIRDAHIIIRHGAECEICSHFSLVSLPPAPSEGEAP